MFWHFFVVLSFVFVSFELTAAADYGPCVTPRNENSLCVELQQCQTLFNLLQKVDLTTQERMFLSQSQCGYKNSKVLVCCPPEAPEGFGANINQGQNSLLPRSPKCGTMLSSRIYGGNQTTIDEYPWMALLEYTKPGNKKGHHCGGALISSRYVITAAHCLLAVPSDWRLTGVRLGEWDISTNPDCVVDARGRQDCAPEYIDVGVERLIPHPQYNPRSKAQENDIALLRLARKISLNDFVKPVCLPLDANLRRDTFSNRELDVAGWGRTEYSDASTLKLKATIKAWDFQRCKTKYQAQRLTLQTTQMCAGGEAGIDSCRGDSGGPLVVEEQVNRRATFYLIGVVSFGPNPCALSGWPGVYTRVGDYIDFIEYNVKP